MRLIHQRTAEARRGVVLLVVLALLTLFAVVAITFVFYSEQEATASRNAMAATTVIRPDPDLPLVYALNQFLLDTNNQESALRYNSLLSNMYGTSGSTPFNGMGRMKNNWSGNVDRGYLVNIGRYFDEATFGSLNPPYTYPDENHPFLGVVGDPNMQGRNLVLARSFVRPCWVDSNGSPAAFDPYDFGGVGLGDQEAFWRGQFLLGLNVNLTADERRAMVTRPGRWDHPNFPLPGARDINTPFSAIDPGGDVRNLPPGWTVLLPNGTEHNGNDSYWMEVGFPVQKSPDGRYYKPLVAMFVMDLDSLLNVNIHGNPLAWDGTNYDHLSNVGLGPWEVSLKHVLNATAAPTEWRQILLGANTPSLYGRLGSPYSGNGTAPGPFSSTTAVPVNQSSWVPVSTPAYKSRMDYDARRPVGANYVASNRTTFPDLTIAPYLPGNQLERFVRFDAAAGYQTGTGGANEAPTAAPYAHPLYFQPFLPAGDDRLFKAWNLAALYGHGNTNTDALYGDLRYLLATNLASNAKARRLLTTHSYDVVRPGVTPFWYNSGDPAYDFAWTDPDPGLPPAPYEPEDLTYPRGGAIQTPTSVPTYANMEFINNTWRANVGSTGVPGQPMRLPRIDLNRPLPAYPGPDATGRIVDQEAYRAATNARKDLARDIFGVLLFATGMHNDPGSIDYLTWTTGKPDSEKDALRWLAQIAVNIVDQRDSDDYVTPFNWDAAGNIYNGWVYGTELPRVVINEVYSESRQPDPTNPMRLDDWQTYLWAELYNPLHSDAALADTGAARLFIPANGPDPSIRCYRLAIYKKIGGDEIRARPNSLGELYRNGRTDIHNWSPAGGQPTDCLCYFDNAPTDSLGLQQLSPGRDYYHGIQGGAYNAGPMRHTPDFSRAMEYGWFMVGPRDKNPEIPGALITFPVNKVANVATTPDPDVPVPLLSENAMSYTESNAPDPANPPTLVLQRLMCPALPYEPDPTSDLYNNYYTVDYVKDVPLNTIQVADEPNDTASNRWSIGKKQPYASYNNQSDLTNSQYQRQDPATFPTQNARNQPRHTFYRHNAVEELHYNIDVSGDTQNNQRLVYNGNNFPYPMAGPVIEGQLDPAAVGPTDNVQKLWRDATGNKVPFDWLTHFDRELTSPMELLHVSAYKPHELTQQLINRQGTLYAQGAPWGTSENRIHRALEFLETRSRVAGVSTQVLRCTTAVNNPGYRQVTFNSNDVNWADNGTPGDTTDDYAWGFGANGGVWIISAGATGATPKTATTLVVEPGVANGETIRVTQVDGFDDPGIPGDDRSITAYFTQTHTPNLTDPSPGGVNYYEVVVSYMAGRVPGKMNLNLNFDFETFAGLLDYQNPNRFGQQVSTTANGPISNANAINTVTPTAWTMTGPNLNGIAWTFEIGSVLIVDTGANQEIVEVTNTNSTLQTFDAFFTKTHANGCQITLDPVETMYRQWVLSRVKNGPVRSLATGEAIEDGTHPQSPFSSGVMNTLFRNNDADVPRPLLVLPGDAHPYIKAEVLNKIMNNVTVRSNCFAVWLTVGYFEVSTPETYSIDPVQLTGAPPQSFTLRVPDRPSTLGIQPGQRVLVDRGANLESIKVTAIDDAARTITSDPAVDPEGGFSKNHTAGFVINGTLGAEIGRADGKEIRHRYFAIIDRSNFEQWVLESLARTGSADVSTIWGNARLDPRRDNPIDNDGDGTADTTLPAPVVYWSRIE